MTPRDIVLNIAVNMGRLGRFAQEQRQERIRQFIDDTDEYLRLLADTPINARFQKTYDTFLEAFSRLKTTLPFNESWAEEAYTWANVLTHRAKLA